MTMAQKPDAQAIIGAVDRLKQAPWLGTARRWWPDYLFHYTDIRNAARILESGQLLSRAAAVATGSMQSENASPDVIEQTAEQWKRFVRFYFRPRTPTQFRNEGFRPTPSRPMGAHCPVPVYLVFASKPLLTRADSLFSSGSLARPGTEPHADAASFETIPFEAVYHDAPYTPEDRDRIVYHRHAEVIVPNEVDLTHLQRIWCRSAAEYQTLLHLLTPETRKRWEVQIGSGGRANLFLRRWTFVEQAVLGQTEIVFKFNPTTETPGPFTAMASIHVPSSGRTFEAKAESLMAAGNWSVGLHHLESPDRYTVRLTLDGDLAYAGEYVANEGPF